jgi:hypothetical protein
VSIWVERRNDDDAFKRLSFWSMMSRNSTDLI